MRRVKLEYTRIIKSWRRYRKNKAGVAGTVIIFFIVFLAIAAPLLAPYDPKELRTGSPFDPPSLTHVMGTDDLGRDILSGVIYGARISIVIGVLAALTATGIGTIVGSVSGYSGGHIDELLMRITEMFQIIPRFFLVLLLVAVFGPSIWNIVLAIGGLGWPVSARLVRAEFLSLKEKEFVEAARALGVSNFRIMFSEILPNAMAPIIINASLEVGHAIALEAGISFLGMGDPTALSWGQMLRNAQRFMPYSPWPAIFPGIAIFITVLGMNLIGDGLNDVLNPRFKGR